MTFPSAIVVQSSFIVKERVIRADLADVKVKIALEAEFFIAFGTSSSLVRPVELYSVSRIALENASIFSIVV